MGIPTLEYKWRRNLWLFSTKYEEKSWMEEALLCVVKRKWQKSINYAYIFCFRTLLRVNIQEFTEAAFKNGNIVFVTIPFRILTCRLLKFCANFSLDIKKWCTYCTSIRISMCLQSTLLSFAKSFIDMLENKTSIPYSDHQTAMFTHMPNNKHVREIVKLFVI